MIDRESAKKLRKLYEKPSDNSLVISANQNVLIMLGEIDLLLDEIDRLREKQIPIPRDTI